MKETCSYIVNNGKIINREDVNIFSNKMRGVVLAYTFWTIKILRKEDRMKEFDAKKEIKDIIGFIREYYMYNKLGGAIIGISGGKDSAVAAGIFTKALGKENVIGVTLPCYSSEEDKEYAKLVSDCYGFELINFDITKIYNTFKEEINELGNFNTEELKNSDINLKPRLRMSALYYLAALYSAIKGKTYLVVGTSNRCEKFVGYLTKGGDSVHDIAPIADYTVEEVIKIGEYLNVPKEVLYRAPADGLSDQTDEEKLGVTYDEITKYMKNIPLDKKIERKIQDLHFGNLHKFEIATYRR